MVVATGMSVGTGSFDADETEHVARYPLRWTGQ
jgi:hypothetical protein